MFQKLLTRYPTLRCCAGEIEKAKDMLIASYESGGKVLLCGNGGSAADCDHIVGELMKGFLSKRPLSDRQKATMLKRCPDIHEEMLGKLQMGLPALSLAGLTALNTAFCNDVEPELIYAQSVLALGKPGDIFIGLSTSGNAKNVCAAAKVAKGLGLAVIGLTGESGGQLKNLSDVTICVPECETFKIQELHLPVYHYICAAVEKHFFEEA